MNKIKKRPYYIGRILKDDPRNPLGKRWLGVNANSTHDDDTHGIHDNNNERSTGKYVSQSCVRMHNAGVEKLFGKVEVGTPVVITYSYNCFVDLTKIYEYQFKGYRMKGN